MSLTHWMELAYTLAWLGGLLLFWFRTGKSLLLGSYIGCSLSVGFDWILGSSRVWNLNFAPDTVMLFSWFGIGQPLWGPVSYGVFYGFILFAWTKGIDGIRRMGIWAYLLLFPGIFLVNLVAEGTIIALTGAYRYALPDNTLFFHVPWMHFFTTGTMAAGIVGLCGATYALVRDLGFDDLDWKRAPDPVWRRHRAVLFVIGIALPQAAYYASLLVAFTLYSSLGLGSSN